MPAVLDAATSVPPSNPALEGLTSMQFVHQMGLGWNLGNTMEACGDWIKSSQVSGFETAWGNPETTREMIDGVKAEGFGSVRIPVAWSNLLGNNYTINPALLERVRVIVDDVLAEGMIAMVNIHWDGGWWAKFPTAPEESMRHYTRLWSQIAEEFKDYPIQLVFESLNEEGCFNDVWDRYGSKNMDQKRKAYDILNDINQNFVNLVRASGGVNSKRHLLIAGYSTDIGLTSDPLFLVPKDPAGRCSVSVHYYSPPTFAILEKDADWGKATRTWGTDAEIAVLERDMTTVKEWFVDRGVPVIVGEYGCPNKNKDPESVRLYLLKTAETSYRMGMCPMLWDAGGHFNRKTLRLEDPALGEGFRRILAMERDL